MAQKSFFAVKIEIHQRNETKLLIDEVIDDNLMKVFGYCLIMWHSVNDCRILYKSVNLNTFCRILPTTTKVSVHFHLKFVQKLKIESF